MKQAVEIVCATCVCVCLLLTHEERKNNAKHYMHEARACVCVCKLLFKTLNVSVI